MLWNFKERRLVVGVGLGWIGLDWIGLSCIGLDCVGLYRDSFFEYIEFEMKLDYS